ncbi:hypothetical protein BCR36DRAFT_358238 [Piromyces finnis]|uniref:Dynein regulatory complex protein 10 n=1 Tax=Piromyces finnis TaxID=1754191 RepID=A0A1Y1V1Q4_9FUNG|nr:hypothetical protein BCR36DRAFT_358238 [Piromyces finnis]|eukprot:ORX45345.1 hypothetical protein BCR36DRAFT_358238 [Piromyces finnis]
MEVANIVLPAINQTNNTLSDNYSKNDKNVLKNASILKLPNTIVGRVKVDKNSKTMSSDSKDALKSLVDSLIGNDNSKNRVRAMDIQRVINIINEIEKKILILNMIPKNLDVVFKIDIGNKAFNIVKMYKDIEKELKIYHNQCTASGMDYTEDENYIELTHQYRTIIRRIYRLFLQDKQLYSRLYHSYKRRMEDEQHLEEDKIKKREVVSEELVRELEQEKSCKKFEMYIKEIKVFFEERLMESVEEEQKQQKKIERIITKEEQTNKQIHVVQNSLNETNLKRYHENKEREKIIDKLSNDLEAIRANSDKMKKRIIDTSNKKNDQTKMIYKQKTDALKAEIELLENQYNELILQNNEEELNLRKKSYKVEGEVENWIHKYDQEVGERHNELEELIKRYNEGNQALSIQRDRFKEVSEEYYQIEKRKEEERLEEERLEKIRIITWTNNAIRIQRVWKKFYAAHGPFRTVRIFFNINFIL